jgi:hypothetical protein
MCVICVMYTNAYDLCVCVCVCVCVHARCASVASTRCTTWTLRDKHLRARWCPLPHPHAHKHSRTCAHTNGDRRYTEASEAHRRAEELLTGPGASVEQRARSKSLSLDRFDLSIPVPVPVSSSRGGDAEVSSSLSASAADTESASREVKEELRSVHRVLHQTSSPRSSTTSYNSASTGDTPRYEPTSPGLLAGKHGRAWADEFGMNGAAMSSRLSRHRSLGEEAPAVPFAQRMVECPHRYSATSEESSSAPSNASMLLRQLSIDSVESGEEPFDPDGREEFFAEVRVVL